MSFSTQHSKPIKLGEVIQNPRFDVTQPRAAIKQGDNPFTKGKLKAGKVIVIAFLALVAILAAVLLVLMGVDGVTDVFSSDTTSDSNAGEPTETEQDVTDFPTVALTDRPTAFPTLFPSFSPTPLPTTADEVTNFPTRSPSASPTNAPITDCVDPDAVCGCNQVQSSSVDIMFLIDVSGSVGDEDFRTMISVIQNFARSKMPIGYRISYIDFNSEVRNSFDFSEFSDSDDLIEELEGFNDPGGATSQRSAFLEAQVLLRSQSGAPREDASLALLMLTDGNPNPCIDEEDDDARLCNFEDDRFSDDGGFCCGLSLAETGGANVLTELSQEFDFSFFYLPVRPDNSNDGPNLELFDAAEFGGNEFETFEIANFNEFETVLGEDIEFPLGPCVDPPTESGSERILRWEDGLL
eukprot:augustus_masked-scaffold_13-processed-gene-8.13-mRNA-1 protein AED:1.00 eAED:1.00 QI:0/-1/0/0/-1/1/1/0/408